MNKKAVLFFTTLLLSCIGKAVFAQVKDSGLVAKQSHGVVLTTNVIDLKLSGGIYLYDYAPLTKGSDNLFNVYAYILKTDAATKDGRFGLHVELRFRDNKLRSFYPSNVWFQESYAYAHTKAGDLHVGKFYNKVGILWDDSFFGNIQYFNGLKLNPEFGAEWVGKQKFGDDNKLDYSLQLISNNSGTNGALPGRDVQSDTIAHFKNGITARIAPTFKISDHFSITPGISGLTGGIDRLTGNSFQMSQLAGELTLNVYNGAVFGEALYLKGEKNNIAHPLSRPGYDDATYLLTGVRYTFFKKLTARVSYSQANYSGSNAIEREVLPGLVYAIRDNIAIITEYDYWNLKPESQSPELLDNSLNFVLHYSF